SGRGRLHQLQRLGIAPETGLQVDTAVRAEARDSFPGLRVDGAQDMVGAEEQTELLPVLALPVVDAAAGDEAGRRSDRVRPDLLAGGGVEGDDRVVVG